MNTNHLFRILISLSNEKDYFLLAQDSYPVLDSCVSQMKHLEHTIDGLEAALQKKLFKIHDKSLGSIKELYNTKEDLVVSFELLKEEALQFWHCCPFDRVKYRNECTERAVQLWNQRFENKAIDASSKEVADAFRDHLKSVVEMKFPLQLAQLKIEEEQERRMKELLNSLPENHLQLDVSSKHHFDLASQSRGSFVMTSMFPWQHFTTFDSNFAGLIGMSRARLMCQPMREFISNPIQLNEELCFSSAGLTMGQLPTLSKSITTYQTASCKLLHVQWQQSGDVTGGMRISRGFDVTDVVDSIQTGYASATREMLRDWLHGIRNASFEQQAELILADIHHLQSIVKGEAPESGEMQHHINEAVVNRSTNAHEDDVIPSMAVDDSIKHAPLAVPNHTRDSHKLNDLTHRVHQQSEILARGMRTFMHAASSTLGMIDQAMADDCKSEQTSLERLINHLRAAPLSLAMREGYASIDLTFVCIINGEEKQPCSENGLVAGEIMQLQAILKELMLVAVRYSDVAGGDVPHLNLVVNIDTRGGAAKFKIVIRDFSRGGLPDHVFRCFQEVIGENKCIDERGFMSHESLMKGPEYNFEENTSEGQPLLSMMSKSNSHSTISTIAGDTTCNCSSNTCEYHIVEVTTNDFSLKVHTSEVGTEFSVHFTLNFISSEDSSSHAPNEKGGGPKICMKKVLVVDDSHIIRRIMSKILTNLNVSFHMCEDGAEALDWFKANNEDCAAIITDLEMPMMGGEALLTAVRSLSYGQLPCYIVTGKEMQGDEFNTLNVKGVVRKPISLVKLREVVGEIYNECHFVD